MRALGIPLLSPIEDAPADAGAGVELTPAQQAAVDAIVARKLAEQIAPGDGQRGDPPALNAKPGETEGAPTVKAERGASWQRRAARYLRAQILAISDNMYEREQAGQMMAELVRETLDLPKAQVEEERKRSHELVDSVKDIRERMRLRAQLDDYEQGIAELRAVPSEKRTMSTLSDAAGGYLVPEPMLAELLYFIEEFGYVRRMFRNVTMTSDTLDWQTLGTKPVAAWYGELERIDPSDMTFGEGGLSSAKLAGISSVSRELEEDALIALLPVYIQLMGEAIAEKEDLAGFLGDGTATYGGQRGVMDLTAAGEASIYTFATGIDTRAEVTLEGLIAAKNTLSRARRRGASWLLPQAVVTALVTLKRNNEANNFVLLDPNSSVGIAQLLGYPVVDPEGLPDAFFPADAVSTIFGAFGDFGRSIFGVRRGFTVETTREGVLNNSAGAITLNAFQQDAVLWKTTERVAMGHPQPDAYVLLKTAAS